MRRRGLVLASFFLGMPLVSSSASVGGVRSVPLCSGITLAASYLAAVGSDQSPGFRFTLQNNTGHEIRLVEPVPSSSHWYARSKGRWLWRASNGAGGSLLDAGNERGRVMVYPAPTEQAAKKFLIVSPHRSKEWIDSPQGNPVLEYKPGCTLCSYPGESEYQVVFAYAYVNSGAQAEGLLPCGLRSVPVPMPPKF
jgi:hypothetical protein